MGVVSVLALTVGLTASCGDGLAIDESSPGSSFVELQGQSATSIANPDTTPSPGLLLHGAQSRVTDGSGVEWAIVEVGSWPDNRTLLRRRDGVWWQDATDLHSVLPDAQVERIAIDPEGTVWIAAITKRELAWTSVRFDGPQRGVLLVSLGTDGWTTHTESPLVDQLVLATYVPETSTNLTALVVGSTGDVWIGFGDSINNDGSGDLGADIDALLRYRAGTWNSFMTQPTNDVVSLAAGLSGVMWALLDEAGCEVERSGFTGRQRYLTCDAVARYDGSTWESWGPATGLTIDGDGPMVVDSAGRLWLVVTESANGDTRLVMFDGQQWHATSLSLPEGTFWHKAEASLGIDADGSIVYTVNETVFSYTPPDPE